MATLARKYDLLDAIIADTTTTPLVGGAGPKIELGLLRKYAEAGDAEAQNALAVMLYDGKGVPKDQTEALIWFHRAAENKWIPAYTNLGIIYFNRREYKSAAKWNTKAGQLFESHALLLLGLQYVAGLGVHIDYQKAKTYLEQSAKRGEILANNILGLLHQEHLGGDYKVAAYWYQEAADQGDATAQLMLGHLYSDGSIFNDREKGVYWYRRAAFKGDAEAQAFLAMALSLGAGVERNDSEAFYWFQQSAKRGNSKGQYGLGACFEDGDGVEKDYGTALHWFRLAAAQGDENAQAKCILLEKRLNTVKEETPVEKSSKKAQYADILTQDITQTQPESFLEKPEFQKDHVQSLLLEGGIPEQASVALSNLAEIAVNNPSLFAAKITAAERVKSAVPVRPSALTYQQQEEVRRRRGAGEPLASLAKEFGVSDITISRTARGISRSKRQN